jgi:hypothetical protein
MAPMSKPITGAAASPTAAPPAMFVSRTSQNPRIPQTAPENADRTNAATMVLLSGLGFGSDAIAHDCIGRVKAANACQFARTSIKPVQKRGR